VKVEILSIRRLTRLPMLEEMYIPMLDYEGWVNEIKMKLRNEEV
jgi:hypothetical protein